MLRDDRQNHLAVCKKADQVLRITERSGMASNADVCKGQWTLAVRKKVAGLNGKMKPVPNSMTNHFQTLNLTVNRSGEACLGNSTQN